MKDNNNYEFVNHPNHYNKYDIEVLDMMERIWGRDALINFCRMNAFKYRMRMGEKPTSSIEQDLAKEKFYLDYANKLYHESLAVLEDEIVPKKEWNDETSASTIDRHSELPDRCQVFHRYQGNTMIQVPDYSDVKGIKCEINDDAKSIELDLKKASVTGTKFK